jgi:hypothetical protein
MQKDTRKRLLIALAGTLFALLVHFINAEMSGSSSWLHETADDPSYLRPAENFADHGTWKDNTAGPSSCVQRPPLYGAIHLVFYELSGSESLKAEMALHFFLHGLALFFLPALFAAAGAQRLRFAGTIVYAALPCFWGFLSYAITESISPSLILLSLAAVSSGKRRSFALSMLLLAALWLLRPVIALIVLFAFFAKVRKSFTVSLSGVSAVVVAVFLIGAWEYRKAGYTGVWPDLHPIYHSGNETMFRPVHEDLSALFRIWETKPEDFHALTGHYWSQKRMPGDEVGRAYFASHDVPLPADIFDSVLCAYSAAENEVRTTFGKGGTNGSAAEKRLSARLRALAAEKRRNNRLQHYAGTPLRSAKEMLGKSQLNLDIFQLVFRGSLAVKLLKGTCVLLIVSGFFCCFVVLRTGNSFLRPAALGAIVYLLYLFCFQRMNEDRYMLPVLPVLLTSLLFTAQTVYLKLSKWNKNYK